MAESPSRMHAWGDPWESKESHPGAVFRVCQACAVRVCVTCAPAFATDTACPAPVQSGHADA